MEQIKLDIIPKGITPICHVSQYDTGRIIRLNLMDGMQGYILTDEEITLNVRKPDNNIITAGVSATSGNAYVDIVTTEQMCACSGDNLCELVLVKDDIKIASLNFKMRVEEDPLKDGIESETEIHNLETQIQDINDAIVPPMVAEEVANQYDSSNVIFDEHPTEGHGIGYTVISENVPDELNDLNDVTISGQASGEALVWDGTKWTNGTVSTVGSIDDLNDVDTTGKATGDNLRYDGNEWVAKPNTVTMTLAEWNAMSTSQTEWLNSHKKTRLIFSDAPNLNETAKQISYDGGTDTVWDKVEGKADISSLATVATSGKYKDLIGLSTALHTGSSIVEAGGSINLSESPTNFMYLLVRFQTNAECQYMLMGTTDNMSLQTTISGHSSQGTATYPLSYNSTIGVRINGNKLDVTNLTYNNANYKARVSNVWGIIRTNA